MQHRNLNDHLALPKMPPRTLKGCEYPRLGTPALAALKLKQTGRITLYILDDKSMSKFQIQAPVKFIITYNIAKKLKSTEAKAT